MQSKNRLFEVARPAVIFVGYGMLVIIVGTQSCVKLEVVIAGKSFGTEIGMKAELSFGSCKKLVVVIAETLFVLVEPLNKLSLTDATTN